VLKSQLSRASEVVYQHVARAQSLACALESTTVLRAETQSSLAALALDLERVMQMLAGSPLASRRSLRGRILRCWMLAAEIRDDGADASSERAIREIERGLREAYRLIDRRLARKVTAP
jgi:hypothetical protein